jgi:heme/copper-type cytochrome/quinol oxidase subunit 3
MYMHQFSGGLFCMFSGQATIIYVMFVWWRDIIREATYEGQHTMGVQIGMRWGMLLFIVSEIMFFFCFFLGIFSLFFITCPRHWGYLSPNWYWCFKSLRSTVGKHSNLITIWCYCYMIA